MKPPPQLAPHVQRLWQEGDELAKKLVSLNAFKGTDIFKGLAPLDAHMISLQGEVMQSYLHILTIRLARANDEANGRLPDVATALGGKPGILRPN